MSGIIASFSVIVTVVPVKIIICKTIGKRTAIMLFWVLKINFLVLRLSFMHAIITGDSGVG
jgi:hypothetical protein